MTEKQQNTRIQQQQEKTPRPADGVPGQYEYDDDEISIGELFGKIWRARGRIAIQTLAAGLVILALIACAYFFQEKEFVAKQEFRLEFTGADQNRYPNGARFSTSDILSSEVLDKVFRRNDLGRYMTFSDFKGGLAVYQTNDRLQMLEYDYSQKFAEKNLSMEVRQRLEQEYIEKKKGLMVPVYSLSFTQAGRAGSVPNDVVAKALQDILAEWAVFAERVKGANQFQLDLVSQNVLKKEELDAEDFLVSTDMLRVMITRVRKNLETVAELPGAKVVRVGEEKVSLADLRHRLQDLDAFKLTNLFSLIRQTAVSKYPDLTLGYLDNKLFNLKLRTDQAAANLAIYENSLNQYISNARSAGITAAPQPEGASGHSQQQGAFGNVPALIPQFGESFIDSLVKMAQENSDAVFRQGITKNMIDAGLEKVDLEFQAKFYEDMRKKISENAGDNHNNAGSERAEYLALAAERVEKTQQEVFDGLANAIRDLNLIYDTLSKSSLNPEGVLFSLPSPALFLVERPLSARRLVMMAVLGMFLCEGVILVAALVKGGGKSREAVA